ncbi:MAG: hypothetical protein M5U29_04250 [Anaerolineae bacterium]|nr:hypothetical protein [Anaerolineae bacterium]
MSKRKRRCEVADGDWSIGGMVSRSWCELLASADAAEQLQRMMDSARQKAAAGSKVHAGIAEELERELVQLRG